MTEPKAGVNILDNSVKIQGSLLFRSDLIFDGNFEGEIHSAGSLTVGENADVQAQIHVRAVVIRGKVTGNIVASERCELKSRSQLYGDLKTARLIIEEGATFVGKSEVSPDGKIPGAERSPTQPQAQKAAV
jgi:cytoskeletal protein CcmA (bactofilin family)